MEHIFFPFLHGENNQNRLKPLMEQNETANELTRNRFMLLVDLVYSEEFSGITIDWNLYELDIGERGYCL